MKCFNGHYAVFVLLLLLLLPCMRPARAEDPYNAVERAIGLMQAGDLDAARQTLAGVQDDEGAMTLLRATRGVLEAFDGNTAAAEAHYRAALERDPQHLPSLWGLSLCLLQRGKAFEATGLIDRAAQSAGGDARVQMLQAYVYQLLDRLSDATDAGKAALNGQKQSPFLLATLAQVHHSLGFEDTAIRFGATAANLYYGMDFLARERRASLPLTMVITDTPRALSNVSEKANRAAVKRIEPDFEQPRAEETVQPPLQIVAPAAGSTVRGLQRVRVVYRGRKEVKFIVFLADQVMRGMLTELPYHFLWDADATVPGQHQLTVRAYDYRGLVIEEDSLTVTTQIGKPRVTPELSARTHELEDRLITLNMPVPAPLSLFSQLGAWYCTSNDPNDRKLALAAYEKAAAIDAGAEGVLAHLAELYKDERGFHAENVANEVIRGAGTGKRVALTFDDGPNPLYTPSILSELKRYGAYATFFLVGKRVQQYPELTQEILAQKHELANHSYTHPNITRLTPRDVISEVLRTRTVIKEVADTQTWLFRPPGGNIDPVVVKLLRSLNYRVVYWDINAGEYTKLPPAKQAAQILQLVKPGSIVLLHNGVVDGTMSILPMLLAGLSERGYTCVTVSELLEGGPAVSAPVGRE